MSLIYEIVLVIFAIIAIIVIVIIIIIIFIVTNFPLLQGFLLILEYTISLK